MHVSTKAIVLSKLRYKDNDLIIKCYTEKFGVQSYLIKGALKSRKGKFKPAYFQLLSLLDVEVTYQNNRSLQYFKDIKLHHNYHSVHTHMVKSAMAMFIAEVLTGILKEEELNQPLYDFLETSFIWLDESPVNTNFHLVFLIEITKYLGFYPETPQNDPQYFNLEDGRSYSSRSGLALTIATVTRRRSPLGLLRTCAARPATPVSSGEKSRYSPSKSSGTPCSTHETSFLRQAMSGLP